jgi:indolepyruvate ferredoxin oxidoreductase
MGAAARRLAAAAAGELTPAMIARAIAGAHRALLHLGAHQARLAFLEAKEQPLASRGAIARTPYFCSGCPHNTSTKVPEGSRALAGIGCHYMATWMDRSTATFTQMGGEGVPWVGQAPFTDTKHVFANLGDGTYFHSGLLAIRAAVAAGVNITYKILYNDAVAMTGGQPHDGTADVPQIAARCSRGRGQASSWSPTSREVPAGATSPHGVTVRHRDELDAVQRELRDVPGVSPSSTTRPAPPRSAAAASAASSPTRRARLHQRGGLRGLRRLRRAVELPVGGAGRDRVRPQARHRPVGLQQGLLLRERLLPELRHRRGRQPAQGQGERRRAQPDASPPARAALPDTAAPWGILITGVGGTGVVTIGALLGMAAHLDGKGVSVLDMTGLAQKGGAVWSHVRKQTATARGRRTSRPSSGDGARAHDPEAVERWQHPAQARYSASRRRFSHTLDEIDQPARRLR